MYEFFSSRNVNKNARDQVHVNDLAVIPITVASGDK